MRALNLGLGVNANVLGGPDASFNFTGSTLPAGLVGARTGAATKVINSVLEDFATGIIRSKDGLLIEPQRTNSLRNGEAQGATLGVIGSGGALPTNWNLSLPASLNAEIIDFNTINGFKYLDLRLYGTPTAGTAQLLFEAASQVVAANAQTWTASAYVQLIGGSLTGVTPAIRISGRDAAGTTEIEGTSQSYTPAIDPKRQFVIRTFNNASTLRAVNQLNFAVTAVPIDVTFRIAAPQLEQGASVTSYIRTNGSTQTRGYDSLYLPTSLIPGYTGPVTVVVTAKTAKSWTASLTGQTLFNFSNGGGGSYVYFSKFRYGAGAFNQRCLQSYSQTGENPGPNIGLDTDFKSACSFGLNDMRMSINGGAISSSNVNTPFPPSGIDRVYIGHVLPDTGQGHEGFTGDIYQIDIYKGVKSDAELQVLSA